MNKKIYFLAILILCLGLNGGIFAADDAFVATTKANEEIAAFNAENKVLLKENEELQVSNAENQNNINDWKKTIDGPLAVLLEKVTKKLSDARANLVVNSDTPMLRASGRSVNKNMKLLRNLEMKKQMLEKSIFEANAVITSNKSKIYRNTQKIEANNKQIRRNEKKQKGSDPN